MPGCNVMVVTPKCPHFTDGRSIIVNKDAEVRLKLAKHNREMMMPANDTFHDGSIHLHLLKSQKEYKYVKMSSVTQ